MVRVIVVKNNGLATLDVQLAVVESHTLDATHFVRRSCVRKKAVILPPS